MSGPIPEGALPDREDVAVIGMAVRFPGARDVGEFWQNLRRGVESVRAFTAEELAACGVDPRVLRDPDYVNAGAVLADADLFASAFFGYSPREADLIDPQHRVFLECAWELLESAGYDPARCPGLVSVYAGVALNTYFQQNLITRPELAPLLGQFQMTLGNEKDFVATRVAYKLNLRGPSFTVQSGCSTSLVATHLACQALLGGECDMALVGGGRIRVPLTAGYHYVEGGVPSPDGHCRAFDADARGCVAGSGIAVVLLKRLSEARRDGDVIHAVLRGSAINNDGSRKIGFTAPSVSGQADVISQALAMADVSADTIGYVEAHGTGTSLGDPIEVAALTQAYRRQTARRGFCQIGSVKTNIGHLDAGAGVAGLIKAILAVKHGEIPPSLNFRAPNPQIDFANSPFVVSTELTPWSTDGGPRRAGVSSFGIGGTNAHVIVEQPPALPVAAPALTPEVLVLSARSQNALDAASANLAAHLRRAPDTDLADVAFTLQLGRSAFPHRRFLVCQTTAAAAAALEAKDSQRVFSDVATQDDPPVVFLFPGGGAQFPGMGRELYDRGITYRDVLDRCLDCAQARLGVDVRRWVFPRESDSAEAARQLATPTLSLTSLFATELALAHHLMSLGVRPSAMLGHSMGEYVAACLAGVFTPEEGVALVAKRGELFETLPEGGMLSVPLPEAELQAMLDPGVSIGAVNAPALCMASGPSCAVAQLEARLAARGVECTRIHIPVAAHSVMLDPILGELERFCRTIALRPPAIPFVSNLSGTWITGAEAIDPGYWVKHLRQTVRFADGLNVLLEQPQRVFLEVGPGRTLSGLARQQAVKARHAIATMRHPKDDETSDAAALAQAIGRLWLAGTPIDWSALHRNAHRRRVVLPTYPFERQRHWIEPAGSRLPVSPTTTVEVAPAPEEPATSAVEAVPAPDRPVRLSRRSRIVVALKQLLHEMSGVEMAALDERATFLALGFESLFLTQANAAFQKKFGVRTTFRQLFEQTPSIDALAGFIDGKLPQDAFGEVLAPAGAPAPASPSTPGDIPTLALLSQQLQSVAAQLERLQRQADGSGSPSDAAELPTMPLQAAAPSADGPPRMVGPWKPVDTGAGGSLSRRQQAHLDALVDRYCRKTARSKQLSQDQRRRLADPRSVSGFRQAWKEMTYQIGVTRSLGSRLWDLDGCEYVDVTMGFSVNLFGFSPAFVTRAIEEQLGRGIEIGVLAPMTRQVAEAICEVTGVDRVCFVNTGSEANMAALRAARTVTGRDRIAVFAGAYHGIFDEALVKPVRIGGARQSRPAAPGIPASMTEQVTVLEYGDPASIDFLRREGGDYAAILVEPVQTRHPDLQPRDFLHALRAVTRDRGIALIFDEVVTGFRLHPRGAQGYFDIDADLVSYGKLIGGGMPMAVVAGKASFMDAFDGGMWTFGDGSFPETGVTFFGGTFVKHPLALAASAAVLEQLKARGPALYEELNRRAAAFAGELNAFFVAEALPLHLEHAGSIFCLTFPGADEYARLLYFHLRDKGVHIYDRPFSISIAHTDEDLAFIIKAITDSVTEMREAGFLSPPAAAARVPVGVSRTETPSPTASPDAVTAPREFPLTEAQLEVWLGCQFGPEASLVFNETSVVSLPGILDPAALERAAQRVVDRHEALRTTFAADGSCQRVAPSLAIAVPLVDLSPLEPAQRAAARESALQAEADTPFDLDRGPLVRFRLLRLSPAGHELILSCHHLVCDGPSFGVVLEDLAALYTEECNGTPALNAPTPFSAFAAWQVAQSGHPEDAANESYWLGQFATAAPVLDLPTDRPRMATRCYRGGLESVVIDASLLDRVRRAGTQTGHTLFCVLLTAYRALLTRLTGQDDVVVGISSSGQNLMGRADLVGHCVNFLPLRIPGADTLPEQMRTVRRVLLDAFDHQNYTFGRLVRKLKLSRDPGRLPLLTAIFNLDPKPRPLRFDAIQTHDRGAPKRHVNVDLQLNAVETDGGLRLDCGYRSDVYTADTIKRWLGYYTSLLEAIAAESPAAITAIPILSDAERRLLIDDWSHTSSSSPAPGRCIHELIEDQAERTPNATALVCRDRTMTYRELDEQANRLARLLRDRGVGPGVQVGVCLDRSVDLVVGLLGVLKAGGAYVPLDSRFPRERLDFMIGDARLATVITDVRLQAIVPAGVGIVRLPEDLAAAPPASILGPTAHASDLAYVIYTSGSTGTPKGVMVEHRNVTSFVGAMDDCVPGPRPGVWLAVTSVAFDISVLELLWTLARGFTVVVFGGELGAPADEQDSSRPREPHARAGDATDAEGYSVRALLGRHAVTHLQCTPSAARLLLIDDATRERLRPLKALLVGGEALPPALASELGRVVSGEIWNLYGPTETTVWSTAWRVDPSAPNVAIGRPLANTRTYVLDAQLQPVPVGLPGHLYIGGAGVARGYWGRTELTAERFLHDPFAGGDRPRMYMTGDVVRYRGDGLLEFLGRSDYQVKIRGHRVELGEIEAVLGRHGAIEQCAVAAREDDAGDTQLVAYVQLRPGSPADEDHLRMHLRRQVPASMVPQVFVVLDRLPVTPNGKLDRKALPTPAGGRLAPQWKYEAPRTPTEQALAAIWSEVLGVDRVGLHDDFFDLGGHSLLATRAVMRIRDVTRTEVSLAAFFEAPTVAAMAARITAAGAHQVCGALARHLDLTITPAPLQSAILEKALVSICQGGSGTPFFWLHGTGGEVVSFMHLSRHLAASRSVYGFAADWTRYPGSTPLTLEAVAARYIQELRTIQPKGPYHLGGYCSAAMPVVEMARQLEDAGEPIGMLAILDYPFLRKRAPVSRLSRAAAFIRNLPRWVRDDAIPSGPNNLQGRLRSWSRRLSSEVRPSRGAASQPPDIRDQLGMWHFPDHQVQMLRLHHQVIQGYEPKPLQGRVTLFLPRTAPLFGPWSREREYDQAWDHLAGSGVDVQMVRGSHSTMLTGSFAQELAARLNTGIEAAERRP